MPFRILSILYGRSESFCSENGVFKPKKRLNHRNLIKHKTRGAFIFYERRNLCRFSQLSSLPLEKPLCKKKSRGIRLDGDVELLSSVSFQTNLFLQFRTLQLHGWSFIVSTCFILHHSHHFPPSCLQASSCQTFLAIISPFTISITQTTNAAGEPALKRRRGSVGLSVLICSSDVARNVRHCSWPENSRHLWFTQRKSKKK